MGKIYLNGIGYGGLSGPCEGDRVYIDQVLLSGTHVADIIVNDVITPIYAPPGAIDDVLVKTTGNDYVSVKDGDEAKIDLSSLYINKQDKLTAGNNIHISNNTISADKTEVTVTSNIHGGTLIGTITVDSTPTELYIPSSLVTGILDVQVNDVSVVDSDGFAKINTSDIVTAGDNINITNGVISATDTTYTAGDNIDITNEVISADVPVLDVNVNGASVIDSEGIAQIKSYEEITQADYNRLSPAKLTDDILYAIIDGRSSTGGGTAFESYLNQGLVAETGNSYVTCNLDKTLTSGYYLVILTDDDTTYSSVFEWNGTTINLSVLGTLEITSTTAGLTQYDSPFRNIYCDILKINLEYNNLPAVNPDDKGKVLAVNNSGNWDVLNVEQVPDPLPYVDFDDNGKILQVVEGMWEAVESPSSNEVPDPTAADVGKVLKVTDANTYDWSPDEGLPAVTSTDNGKILKVVEGAWDKTNASATTFNAIKQSENDNGIVLQHYEDNVLQDYTSFVLPYPIRVFDSGEPQITTVSGHDSDFEYVGFGTQLQFKLKYNHGLQRPLKPGYTLIDSVMNTKANGGFPPNIHTENIWWLNYGETVLSSLGNAVQPANPGNYHDIHNNAGFYFILRTDLSESALPILYISNKAYLYLQMLNGDLVSYNYINYDGQWATSITTLIHNYTPEVEKEYYLNCYAPSENTYYITFGCEEDNVQGQGSIFLSGIQSSVIGIPYNIQVTALNILPNIETVTSTTRKHFIVKSKDLNDNTVYSLYAEDPGNWNLEPLSVYDYSSIDSYLSLGDTIEQASIDTYINAKGLRLRYPEKLTNEDEIWIKVDKSDLPKVTDDDNGKILKVTNGTWTKSVSNYLPLTGGTLTGNLVMDGSDIIVASNHGIEPAVNNTSNIGTLEKRYTNIYAHNFYATNGNKHLRLYKDDIVFDAETGFTADTWDGFNTSLKTAVTSAKDSVKQENTSSGGLYRILLSDTTNDNPYTGSVRKSNTLTYNPLNYQLVIGSAPNMDGGSIVPAWRGGGYLGTPDYNWGNSYISTMHGNRIVLSGYSQQTTSSTDIGSTSIIIKDEDNSTGNITSSLSLMKTDITLSGSNNTWDGTHTSLKATIQAILARL